MQSSEKQIHRLLAELKKKAELFHLCVSYNGSGPIDGCCYAMAKALQENIGGELYSMWGRNFGSDINQAHHVLVKVGDQYWDGEGRHTESSIKQLWETKENLYDIDFKPFQENDVPDSPRSRRFVATLSQFFKSVMEVDPEETARKRSIVHQLYKTQETDVNPMDAIAHLLKSEEWQSLTPIEINSGNCDEFAYDLIKHTGGELWETRLDGDFPTHRFLKWQNKYYDAMTPLGVKDWKHLPMFRPAVEIRQNHIDGHSGQDDYELVAEHDGNVVGVLQYSVYQGEPKIDDIYVDREVRRHGIATELVFKLQESYPDIAIDWGFMSKNEDSFYQALPHKLVPIENVIAAQQKLKNVKEKLADYTQKAEQLYKNGKPTPDQLEKYHQETADWNELHEKRDDLECYEDEATHKNIVEVPTILDYEEPYMEQTTIPVC